MNLLSNGEVNKEFLKEYLDKFTHNSRFKEFALEQINNTLIQITEDNNIKSILDLIQNPSNSISKNQLRLLIESGIDEQELKNILPNLNNHIKSNTKFSLSSFINHPEFEKIITLLKQNGIKADISEIVEFEKAINLRDYNFLNIILDKYPNHFNCGEDNLGEFEFFEKEYDPEDFFYPKQKIEFTSWLIEKTSSLNNQNLKENLTKLINDTMLFGCELLETDNPKLFRDYFIKIADFIEDTQLVNLLDVRNINNETALHILALQLPKEFPKILETIVTKINEDQFLELILSEEDKYNNSFLHILAIKNPKIFLEALEIIHNNLCLAKFIELLEYKADEKTTLIDLFLDKNPKEFNQLLEFLNNKLNSKDLTELLLNGEDTTVLHNLARNNDPQYFIDTLKILTNKLNSQQLITLLAAERTEIFTHNPLHIMASKHPEEFENVIEIVKEKLNSNEIEELLNKEISIGNLKLTVLGLLEISKTNNIRPSNNITPNSASNLKNTNEFTNKKQGRE